MRSVAAPFLNFRHLAGIHTGRKGCDRIVARAVLR
jgi:hypothetical protein